MRDSPEHKGAVLGKMLPPHNRGIRELAEAELSAWCRDSRAIRSRLEPISNAVAEGLNLNP